MAKHYLLYGSVRYALAILRPLQEAIRARGDEAAWFFDGDGASELETGERLLSTVEQVREWNPLAIFTSSNALPHFMPGVKVQTFHGFDAGKPRHLYIRPFFDLYCTTGPNDTAAFQAMARERGYFKVVETGWPKLDPFLRRIAGPLPVEVAPLVEELNALVAHNETQAEEARRHATDRMVQNAQAMGANAVVMMRFDSSEIGQTMSEIVAYGTAVVIEKVGSP